MSTTVTPTRVTQTTVTPTKVFILIDVQGTFTGSPETFRWVRTNADTYSLGLKPSHGHSTMPHGQPQLQRGRGAIHRQLCLRRRHRQTLVQHRRHCLYNPNRQLCLRRGHQQTWVQHCRLRRYRQHPQHWRRQTHRRRMSNLITDTCTINAAIATSLPAHRRPYPQHVNAARVTSLPAHRRPYPQHEILHCCVGILIAGTLTTSVDSEYLLTRVLTHDYLFFDTF